MTTRVCKISGLLALLAPTAALAHPGHSVDHLMAGLVHPLTGLDHMLMILAVGAWSALLAPRARLLIAACLALFVGLGALWPLANGAALEMAIAITVVGAGVLLALGRRLPLWTSALLAGLFAFIHGIAHGNEGPDLAPAYVAGLALATGLSALLVGAVVAHWQSSSWWGRAAGAITAAWGVFALAG